MKNRIIFAAILIPAVFVFLALLIAAVHAIPAAAPTSPSIINVQLPTI